jgi:protein O-mannosyl-transferase
MASLVKDWKKILDERPFAARAILFVAAIVLFAPTLSNGFVYDDLPQIIENPFVTNPHMWRQIFTGNVWSFSGEPTNFYRPLQALIYWVLYRFAGANAAPFHLVSVLLFGAAACLVFGIGCRLLDDPGVAFLGSAIWLMHPAKVEAVTWISSLPDLGSAVFYLLALLWCMRAEAKDSRGIKDYLLPALFFFIALFFKEMAVTLPLLVLVYWFLLGREESWKRRLAGWLMYPSALVVYGIIRYKALGYLTIGHHLLVPSGGVIAASLGLLGQNTKVLIWPFHLNVFRVFNLKASLVSPWPWIALAVIAAALWLRKLEPRLAFLILWWPITLLPVLDIRQLSFPYVADRFSFLPSAGPALLFAFLLFRWFPRRLPVRHATAIASIVLVVIAAFYVRETLRLIPTWNDNETLFAYSMREVPNSPLVHMAKGVDLEYRYNDLDGALKQYHEAWKLNSESSRPLGIGPDYYDALGRIALRKGQKEEAIKYFEKALQIDPRKFAARDALGAIYFSAAEYAKAAGYFSVSVELDPQDLGARFYLGICYMKLGKSRRAAEQFHAAREVDPDYLQAYQAEARALDAAGDSAAAARVRSRMPKP